MWKPNNQSNGYNKREWERERDAQTHAEWEKIVKQWKQQDDFDEKWFTLKVRDINVDCCCCCNRCMCCCHSNSAWWLAFIMIYHNWSLETNTVIWMNEWMISVFKANLESFMILIIPSLWWLHNSNVYCSLWKAFYRKRFRFAKCYLMEILIQ